MTPPPTIVTLEPADYWRLRTLAADSDRERLNALLAQQRIEAARTAQQTFFATLAAKYPTLTQGPLTFDDATCSLVAAPTEPAPAKIENG